MSRIILESGRLPDHPAVRAWNGLGGATPAAVERWRRVTRTKPAIYRLTFATGQPAVFAKRFHGAGLALERMVYEEILPRLPLAVPRYRGFEEDLDGSAWMFLEDVGHERLSDDEPEHRVLAARWLGLLHRSAAGLEAAARLPDAGPGRYLAHLRSGREGIRRSLVNRGLTSEDRAILAGVLEQQDALESGWQQLERACEGLPVTLVHGDFRSKNVRLRDVDGTRVLHVIDWEMAGWGIPAADLGGVCGPRMTIEIDPHAYQETARERWRDLDAAAIRRLSVLGRLFQALASIEWASASLRFESRACLLKPVSSMRVYRGQIAAALEAGAEWLG